MLSILKQALGTNSFLTISHTHEELVRFGCCLFPGYLTKRKRENMSNLQKYKNTLHKIRSNKLSFGPATDIVVVGHEEDYM